jgi:hypothetical protein
VLNIMGTLCKLDHTGDTKLIWDPANVDEVAAARTTFDSLKAKGFIAYRVAAGGEKGTVLSQFDKSAEKIIMTPALQGG